MFIRIIDEYNGQASAEMILLIGGILIIVVVLAFLYNAYIRDVGDTIKNNEVKNINNAIKNLSSKVK
ncbi:MAG: class III signal peptide-containing protein [Methanobacteriaceae archaeon]